MNTNTNGFSPEGGNFGYNPYFDPWYFEKREKDRRTLKKLSLYAGGALLLYILVQNVIFLSLEVFGLMDLYNTNQIFSTAFDVILVIFGMLLPFAFMGRKMKKVSYEAQPVLLTKPTSALATALAVVAGLGLCMVANYVTSFVTVFMALFGLEPTAPDIPMPTGFLGVTLTVVKVVIAAAVVEELSLRGFVMGNLRRYGDTFAIIMSAFVFAFMHGNLIQTPFALVAGFGLGYFSVKTNSLWTGILIHAFNNLISVSVTYLYDILPEDTLNLIYIVLVFALIIFGAVCFFLFVRMTRHTPLRKNQSTLSTGECVRYYLTSPTMIISMLFMLYITVIYIQNLGT